MKSNCPHCNSINDFNEEAAATMVDCPKCGNLFVLKSDGLRPISCPDCAREVAPEARICLHCGFNFDTGKKLEKHIPVHGEDFSPPLKLLTTIADYFPGLFKIHTLLLSLLSIMVTFAITFFVFIFFSLGALNASIFFAVCALVVYAHGVGFILTGEAMMLRSVFMELSGAKWSLFLFLVFSPPIAIFLIMFQIASAMAG